MVFCERAIERNWITYSMETTTCISKYQGANKQIRLIKKYDKPFFGTKKQ